MLFSWAVPRLQCVHSFPKCVLESQELILLKYLLLKHPAPIGGKKGGGEKNVAQEKNMPRHRIRKNGSSLTPCADPYISGIHQEIVRNQSGCKKHLISLELQQFLTLRLED